MSGHSRWWLDNPETAPADEHMVQYVQGYILALNDVLRDIETMRFDAEEASSGFLQGHGMALDGLERQVTKSRTSALRTLETITKKVDAAE